MKMNDLELVRHIQALEAKKANIEHDARVQIEALKQKIRAGREIQNRRKAELDENKILLAEHVIHVSGPVERNNEGCLEDAINDLAHGTRGLRQRAFAVKDYAQFRGQRCDCEYGFGPKHGSHVFTIGLTREARTRDLSDDEANAAIYYLLHLDAIQKASAAARTN